MCKVCARAIQNPRLLGVFEGSDGIFAHSKCVLFSPVVPDKVHLKSDGICGLSERFIRTEGKRAKSLVIFSFRFFLFFHIAHRRVFFALQICIYRKKGGANVGCCFDIGTDKILKFCSRRYHVDCGLAKGASFTVSLNCGTVSLCYGHRNSIEK